MGSMMGQADAGLKKPSISVGHSTENGGRCVRQLLLPMAMEETHQLVRRAVARGPWFRRL
jgi:hypothetical protein